MAVSNFRILLLLLFLYGNYGFVVGAFGLLGGNCSRVKFERIDYNTPVSVDLMTTTLLMMVERGVG